MQSNRKPTLEELRFIEFMVNQSSVQIDQNWAIDLLVQPMSDGAMGSLLLLPPGVQAANRTFLKQICEFQFVDLDGVLVSASLNIDANEQLFELDVWKTNFEPLISFPAGSLSS